MAHRSPRCQAPACGHARQTHTRGYSSCRSCNCARFYYVTPSVPATKPPPQGNVNPVTPSEPMPAKVWRSTKAPLDLWRFDSFTDLCEAVLSPAPPTFGDNAYELRSKLNLKGNSRLWYGLDEPGQETLTTSALVASFLGQGWVLGVERMREALGQVALPVMASVRRRGVWSDDGEELSPERLFTGNLETCWRTTRKQASGAPVRLQIIVNAGALHTVSASAAFWRGAAATVIAEAACAAGYSVAVDSLFHAVAYAASESRDYAAMVRVKAYESPLDLSGVAAMTAHPSMLRALVHPHRARSCPVRISEGYGRSQTVDEAQARDLGLVDPSALVLVVPGNCLTVEAARQWVAATVATLEAQALGQAS